MQCERRMNEEETKMRDRYLFNELNGFDNVMQYVECSRLANNFDISIYLRWEWTTTTPAIYLSIYIYIVSNKHYNTLH